MNNELTRWMLFTNFERGSDVMCWSHVRQLTFAVLKMNKFSTWDNRSANLHTILPAWLFQLSSFRLLTSRLISHEIKFATFQNSSARKFTKIKQFPFMFEKKNSGRVLNVSSVHKQLVNGAYNNTERLKDVPRWGWALIYDIVRRSQNR